MKNKRAELVSELSNVPVPSCSEGSIKATQVSSAGFFLCQVPSYGDSASLIKVQFTVQTDGSESE